MDDLLQSQLQPMKRKGGIWENEVGLLSEKQEDLDFVLRGEENHRDDFQNGNYTIEG